MQAGLAQLVERFSCKEDVVGSNPTPGSRGPFICESSSSRTRTPRPSGRTTASTSRASSPLSSGTGTRSCSPPRASKGAAAGARCASTRASPWRARSAARRQRPDVVWGHFLVPTGTIARRAARAARVPYAVTAHGTDVANAERSPRIRKATLAARRATPAPSSRSRATWPRVWMRSWARSASACTSSAPASISRRSRTATRTSRQPRSDGTPTGRASPTSGRSFRARTSRASGGLRGCPRRVGWWLARAGRRRA